METADTQNEYVIFGDDSLSVSFVPKNERFRIVRVPTSNRFVDSEIKFLSVLLREKLDLMHFTDGRIPLGYWRSAILTVHDITPLFYPGRHMTGSFDRSWYRFSLGKSVHRARRIITPSKYTKKDLVEVLAVEEDSISVVANGIRHELFDPVVSDLERDKIRLEFDLQRPYFLVVGTSETHKNLPRLLESYAELVRDPSFSVDLVLVGREDPVYHEVRDVMIRENLQKRVHILGFVPDEKLPALYQSSAAYVFPSLYEGFGLPVLEAMASGVPVVAAKTSSLPEVAGEHGAIWFSPTSNASIQDALRRVLSDDELRTELVANGKRRAQEFSWEKMGQETLEIYREFEKSLQA